MHQVLTGNLERRARGDSHTVAEPPFFSRIRFQLLGGIAFAVVGPAVARFSGNLDLYRFTSAENTIIGSAIAMLAGFYFFRRLRGFPGAHAIGYLLTAFTISYLAAIFIFFFLRIDYSRYQFASSFLLSLVWFLAAEVIARRSNPLRLALVPGGDVAKVSSITSVDWISLQRPVLSARRWAGVVADLRADLGIEWERFITDCAVSGIPVFHVKQVTESLTGRVEIEHLSENTLGTLLPNLAYAKLKQVWDFVAACLLLPILLPVFAVVGLMIRLETPGPALFRQERMGYRGIPFIVYKFRTMRLETAQPAQGRARAMTATGDARVTRLGRFLRRTRIDELPQVFNILRGEMSFIGPRPEAMVLSRWYESELPFYRYRHVVRPGISGWAQVNQGHVAEVDQVLEKLHYDFFYIKHFSMWLDLLIVFRTVMTVLTGFGAR